MGMSWRGFLLLSGFWLAVLLSLSSRLGLFVVLVTAAVAAVVVRIVQLRRRSGLPVHGRAAEAARRARRSEAWHAQK